MSKIDTTSLFKLRGNNHTTITTKNATAGKMGAENGVITSDPIATNRKDKIDTSALTKLGKEPKQPHSDAKMFNMLKAEGRAKGSETERVRAICAEYARNGDTARNAKTEILKGMKKGVPIAQLFLKACECISAMTGEDLFSNQIKKDLLTIYGKALGEPDAVEIMLRETNERLRKLKSAKDREQKTDELHRINSAIEAHQKEIKEIEKLIEK